LHALARTGVFQAVFTAGTVLPTPVAKCRYWHRNLNPKKLVNVGFSHLTRRYHPRPLDDDDAATGPDLMHARTG
jgi:hypothetical protein